MDDEVSLVRLFAVRLPAFWIGVCTAAKFADPESLRRVATKSWFMRNSLGFADGWLVDRADRWFVPVIVIGMISVVAACVLRGAGLLVEAILVGLIGASMGALIGAYTELLYGLEFHFRAAIVWWALAGLPAFVLAVRGMVRSADDVAIDAGMTYGGAIFGVGAAMFGAVASLIGGGADEEQGRAETATTVTASSRPPTASSRATTTTLDLLLFDPAAGFWGLWPISDKPELGAGDSGDAVRYLQGVLIIKAGQAGVTVSGVYDDATRSAVVNVQLMSGVGADGRVGPITWPIIDALAVG